MGSPGVTDLLDMALGDIAQAVGLTNSAWMQAYDHRMRELEAQDMPGRERISKTLDVVTDMQADMMREAFSTHYRRKEQQ